MDRNEPPLDPPHLGAPLGASKTISEPMVHLAPTVLLSYMDTNRLQMDRNEIPHDPRQQGVSSGASKTISEPMVYSAQTVHLSCIKISTIPKQIETSFHLSLVTLEYHRGRPKQFLSLWY